MGSDDPRDLLTVVQKNKGGNPADAKPLRNVGRRVGVDLHQLQAAGPLLCDLLHDGRDDPARAAPGSPEIDEDRERALLDDRRVVGLATFRQPGQRRPTDATVRDTIGGPPDPIPPAGLWARDQGRFRRPRGTGRVCYWP